MTFPVRPALCAGCLLAAQAVAQSNDTAPPQPQMQTPPRTQTQPEVTPPSAPLTRAQVRAALAQARADGSIPRYGNPPGR
ncbi:MULTISPECIES: DUF4148 domain-containing protein [unclassified Caballeronia]|uniref:DUF4148 domain-containing protein n=1 Tax=unclassified Caballeronia TaxID=2646786 RepID=UPI00285F1C04|nr:MULTISPECIES: DUF4148 domain-containing protein [unclassified Caballeronia]MDR5824512.1 DUF4148 domain-containing protein [Caballeronia sp. LZ043]MDR5882404.1 DUF4148 domain-containing protein [Caballeronia sp. LZ032]